MRVKMHRAGGFFLLRLNTCRGATYLEAGRKMSTQYEEAHSEVKNGGAGCQMQNSGQVQ